MDVKRMFEDDEFKLVKELYSSFWLFTYLGSIFVYSKSSEIVRKLTRYEKRYYFFLLRLLVDKGIGPGTEEYGDAMHDFCRAVICRDAIIWQVYFEDSPQQKVKEYI